MDALDVQAQLNAQMAAAGDQIHHLKWRMHETTQIISHLLDMVVSGQQATSLPMS